MTLYNQVHADLLNTHATQLIYTKQEAVTCIVITKSNYTAFKIISFKLTILVTQPYYLTSPW